MKASTFSITFAALSIIYAAGCYFFFNQPFWSFTALCLGTFITLYPFHLERQRLNLIAQTQLAEYLSENLPADKGKSVLRLKIRSIVSELELIRSGIVPLTHTQLAYVVELRMKEKTAELNLTKYYATHIVDSNESLGIWGNEYSPYANFSSYVGAQKRVLDNGGIVSRLFLFEPSWLKQHIKECRRTIERHEILFSDSIKPITTLCAFIPRDIKWGRADFSILDEQEVFLWERAPIHEAGVFIQGQYIMNPSNIRDFVEEWNRLSTNALSPAEFFNLIDN